MRRHSVSLQTVKNALRQLEKENLIVSRRGSGIYVSEERSTRLIIYHRSRHPSFIEDLRENSLRKAIINAGWHLDVRRHEEIDINNETLSPEPKACAHVLSQDMLNLMQGLIRLLMQQAVPLLVLGRETDIEMLDYVTYNDQQILSLLVKHLRTLGHRKLAFLVNEPISYYEISRRQEHFKEILEMMDLPEGTLIDCNTQPGQRSTVMAYKGLKQYLEGRQGSLPFTGIIVASAMGGLGALRALHESGISVPDDCSVAAFGTDQTNDLTLPSLTDAGIHMAGWGECAVQLLQERFDGNKLPFLSRKIPAQMTIRESTAAAPS